MANRLTDSTTSQPKYGDLSGSTAGEAQIRTVHLADPGFWVDLRNKFIEVRDESPEPEPPLRTLNEAFYRNDMRGQLALAARLLPVGQMPNDCHAVRSEGEHWKLYGPLDGRKQTIVQRQVRVLAVQAAAGIGFTGVAAQTLDYWLEFLRDSPDYSDEDSILRNVCSASANYCRVLETLVIERTMHNREITPKKEASTDSHKARPSIKATSRYAAIDAKLKDISESKPRSHQDVFRRLDGERVANAEPFRSARGWFAGFKKDPEAARAWLSKRWSLLGLPSFPRGPK